jgi:hypothetical protein
VKDRDAVLPYGTPVCVTAGRISLTCVATCGHGGSCSLVGARDVDGGVVLYFHGAAEHGALLNERQRQALAGWLSGSGCGGDRP